MPPEHHLLHVATRHDTKENISALLHTSARRRRTSYSPQGLSRKVSTVGPRVSLRDANAKLGESHLAWKSAACACRPVRVTNEETPNGPQKGRDETQTPPPSERKKRLPLGKLTHALASCRLPRTFQEFLVLRPQIRRLCGVCFKFLDTHFPPSQH